MITPHLISSNPSASKMKTKMLKDEAMQSEPPRGPQNEKKHCTMTMFVGGRGPQGPSNYIQKNPCA